MELRDFIFAMTHYILAGLCLWATIKSFLFKKIGWGSYGTTATLLNFICAICYTVSWIL